jgi:hypothetical protein
MGFEITENQYMSLLKDTQVYLIKMLLFGKHPAK